jgi:predicted dithiol-disulfide oxidoreductase (DUF899 family)
MAAATTAIARRSMTPRTSRIAIRPAQQQAHWTPRRRPWRYKDDGQVRDDDPPNHAAMGGTDLTTYLRERPGMSAFVLEDGDIYHTYSTYSRGLDGLWGMYQWLDRAPRGRNEKGPWWRRHDESGAR